MAARLSGLWSEVVLSGVACGGVCVEARADSDWVADQDGWVLEARSCGKGEVSRAGRPTVRVTTRRTERPLAGGRHISCETCINEVRQSCQLISLNPPPQRHQSGEYNVPYKSQENCRNNSYKFWLEVKYRKRATTSWLKLPGTCSFQCPLYSKFPLI